MTHQWRVFFTAVISKIPCLRSIPRKILKMEIFYKKKSPLPSKLWSDWLWKQLWVKGAWSSVLVQNFSIVLIPGRPPSLWLIKVALQGIYGMRRSISLESWSGGRLKRGHSSISRVFLVQPKGLLWLLRDSLWLGLHWLITEKILRTALAVGRGQSWRAQSELLRATVTAIQSRPVKVRAQIL